MGMAVARVYDASYPKFDLSGRGKYVRHNAFKNRARMYCWHALRMSAAKLKAHGPSYKGVKHSQEGIFSYHAYGEGANPTIPSGSCS